MLSWSEKYRPRRLSEVVGNEKAKHELIEWAERWINQDPGRKPAILYGSAGVGKTSAAHALANEMGWEVVELNASDQRTAAILKKVAGVASSSRGLLKGGFRLIILDEADNLHGTADYGGSREILRIIRSAQNPILLTANDLYGISKAIRDECDLIQFKAIRKSTIVTQLKRICKSEGIVCDELALKEIAEGKHDLRSAINDLQAIAEGKSRITINDVVTGLRDRKESIFNLLSLIFRGEDMEDVFKASYNLDETPEALIHWIDENLPRQFSEDALARGMSYLSKSDRFLGMVKRRQNYRFWRYASFLMICGVIQAISGAIDHDRRFVRYQPPSYFRKISQTRGKRRLMIELGLKIAKATKTDEEYGRLRLIPLLREIFRDMDRAAAITAEFELTQDEVSLILGEKGKKRAKEIVKLAASIREERKMEEEGVMEGAGVITTSSDRVEAQSERSERGGGQKTLFEFG